MTRTRPEADPSVFRLPDCAPAYAGWLDGMDEAEARRRTADGGRILLGPSEVADFNIWHACLRSDGPEAPFVVTDFDENVRGTFPSWPAAAGCAVAEAAEVDAALAAAMARAMEERR